VVATIFVRPLREVSVSGFEEIGPAVRPITHVSLYPVPVDAGRPEARPGDDAVGRDRVRLRLAARPEFQRCPRAGIERELPPDELRGASSQLSVRR
jgi:hypothetical protein